MYTNIIHNNNQYGGIDKMKTKYMVMAKNKLGEMEIQTELDELELAEEYAKDNSKYQTQYIVKTVCLKIVKGDEQ